MLIRKKQNVHNAEGNYSEEKQRNLFPPVVVDSLQDYPEKVRKLCDQ
jgi:hypothetical protein